MASPKLSLTFCSAEITASYAKKLAQKVRPGDVILLSGDVGAGKTHFARAFIQSLLAIPEDVPSPTFTLVQTYETPKGDVWHADLYRLTSTYEIEELGLTEAFDNAVCLIEWPDRLDTLTPQNALHLHLETDKDVDSRQLEAHWTDRKWEDKLIAWQSI